MPKVNWSCLYTLYRLVSISKLCILKIDYFWGYNILITYVMVISCNTKLIVYNYEIINQQSVGITYYTLNFLLFLPWSR